MPGRMPRFAPAQRLASLPLVGLALIGLALAALLCLLTGCTTRTLSTMPAGVEVSVHQNRPDTEDRRLQVRITNGSDAPLTVNSLTLSSLRFDGPAEYPKAPSMVGAGATLDLPVALPPPVCDAGEGTPAVRIEFEHGSQAGSVSVQPEDPLDQWDGIWERDCLEHAMAATADISEPDRIRVEPVDGRLVAFVDLIVTPTGGSGSFTIHAIDDTVLFGLLDPESHRTVVSLPVGLTIRGDGEPGQLTVPLVPARCDAHAVAEDKRGTLLPLRVEVGEVSGIRYFALSDDRKGELYSYLDRACARR